MSEKSSSLAGWFARCPCHGGVDVLCFRRRLVVGSSDGVLAPCWVLKHSLEFGLHQSYSSSADEE